MPNTDIPSAPVKTKIAPSVLASDLDNLTCECKHVLDMGADWLYIGKQSLFVSSPEMIETLQRFGDVVIADVAQGRNMYQMPLNVFCVVDGAGRTRNVAYVVQDRQDHDAHQWARQQLVSASGSKPSVIMSDQDAAFMSASQGIRDPLERNASNLSEDTAIPRNLSVSQQAQLGGRLDPHSVHSK
ncbi:unnamed protein product, partial [Tilletia caries]